MSSRLEAVSRDVRSSSGARCIVGGREGEPGAKSDWLGRPGEGGGWEKRIVIDEAAEIRDHQTQDKEGQGGDFFQLSKRGPGQGGRGNDEESMALESDEGNSSWGRLERISGIRWLTSVRWWGVIQANAAAGQPFSSYLQSVAFYCHTLNWRYRPSWVEPLAQNDVLLGNIDWLRPKKYHHCTNINIDNMSNGRHSEKGSQKVVTKINERQQEHLRHLARGHSHMCIYVFANNLSIWHDISNHQSDRLEWK